MSNVRRLQHVQGRMRLLLAVLVALACSLCQAQQTVEFADGQVEVVLPSEFRIVARPRQSLIATFGAKGDGNTLDTKAINDAI